jgi:hypothetical protein
LFLVACGGGADLPAAIPDWTLSAEPTLVIGEDGTPAGEFDRVSMVLALPGDEIAVVDAGVPHIKVFSPTGVFQRTIGRQGQGPGEFNSIGWVQLSGDTLIVYDGSQRRITLLGLDGAVYATLIPRPAGGGLPATPVLRARDGSWLVRTLLASIGPQLGTGPPPAGITRDTTVFGFLAASGEGAVDQVLRLPSQPVVMAEGGVGGFAAFSEAPSATPLGERIVIADPAAGTLWSYSAAGHDQSTTAVDIPRRPLAQSELDSIRQAELASAQSPRIQARIEARLSPAVAPAEYPVFRSLVPDGDDQLWLEEWQLNVPISRRYVVIGADGSWRASIQMPARFLPTAIGADWVLGIHRDEDGLGRVMKFGLERR